MFSINETAELDFLGSEKTAKVAIRVLYFSPPKA